MPDLKNARFLDLMLAIETVNSSTSYVYDPRTRTYLQPVSASSTLQKFLAVNSPLLQKLRIPENFPIEGRDTITQGAPLTDLIAVGVKDQSSAPAILSTLMEILGKQTEYVARYVDPGRFTKVFIRYPVLLAIDDFQALYCKTSYKDPQFSTIKSYHLSMPRLLLEYASGKKSFVRFTCTVRSSLL